MMNDIRRWKIMARQSLRGKYGLPVVATLLLFFYSLLGSDLTNRLFPGDDALSLITSQVFAFVLSLLITLFTTGVGFMYLNISRNKQAGISDFFFFFKNQPDRILFAAFILALIEYIVTIPASYYGLVNPPGNTMEALRTWMYHIALLSALSVVLNFILTLPFKMTFFLLADDSEMSSKEALKCSVKMMRHHLGRFLLMEISFLPWILVCLYFTFGIGFLWLVPYMRMAEVFFYRNLRGELDGHFTDYYPGTAGEEDAGGGSGQAD